MTRHGNLTNGARRFITAAATAALVACLVAPAAAAATTLVNGDTGQLITGQFARWTAESKMPTPTGQITIYPESDTTTACNNRLAVACSAPGQIWVEGAGWHVGFLHELGHQWDFQHMAPDPTQTETPTLEPWQQEFERIWHLNTGWWQYLPGDGLATPGEWFATAYQMCAIHGQIVRPPNQWWGMFKFPAYARMRAMIASCLLIEEVNVNPDMWENDETPPAAS